MNPEAALHELTPPAFVELLHRRGISRFYLVWDAVQKRAVASHPELQPLAQFLEADGRDYNQHEGLFFELAPDGRTLMGAFIHKTCRGQAAGGVRYWPYDTVESYLRDGLRLARGMTRKCALAGLWWGGGKGVILQHPDVDREQGRTERFRAYGQFITSLAGCYVTAEDVGTRPDDMARIFETTRYTTCIPASTGGSGNPSQPTARGVFAAMEAALEHLDLGTLAGKTVAVQGMGNVGGFLIDLLLSAGVERIVATDINAELVQSVTARVSDARLQASVSARGDDSILSTPCDILAPCATGAVLNARTIPSIQARIVCGAANNQLEDAARDDALLHERGITYVPDFLANRMGIVNCSNEQYGYLSPDPAMERHLSRDWEHSIHRTTRRVLEESGRTGDPPGRVADRQADGLASELHPIFGHRGVGIIRSLVQNQWEKHGES